jgi:hypothetical protein
MPRLQTAPDEPSVCHSSLLAAAALGASEWDSSKRPANRNSSYVPPFAVTRGGTRPPRMTGGCSERGVDRRVCRRAATSIRCSGVRSIENLHGGRTSRTGTNRARKLLQLSQLQVMCGPRFTARKLAARRTSLG